MNLELSGIVGKDVLLPVATGFVAGSGDNGRLRVSGVMAAFVCAVNLPSGAGERSTSDPRCGAFPTPGSPGANQLPTTTEPGQPRGYFTERWDTMDPEEALLWVVPSQFLTSGAPLDPSAGCAVGNPDCDFGVRGVQLWK